MCSTCSSNCVRTLALAGRHDKSGWTMRVGENICTGRRGVFVANRTDVIAWFNYYVDDGSVVRDAAENDRIEVVKAVIVVKEPAEWGVFMRFFEPDPAQAHEAVAQLEAEALEILPCIQDLMPPLIDYDEPATELDAES